MRDRGSGNIGRALLLYKGFEMFQMNAIFDVNPEIIGTKMDGVEVRSMFNFDEYVKNNDINVGGTHLHPGQRSARDV